MENLKNVFAERFKSARVLNGLSLQDLANRLENEITRQALFKYEKGEVIPNSTMLSKIANILKVHPDYFFKASRVQIGEVKFRKLPNLLVKEEEKIKEILREYMSNYLEIEDILHMDREFENPIVNKNVVRSIQDIDEVVNCLRGEKGWNIGEDPIYNVVEFLEDKFIKVIPVAADNEFDGLQTKIEGKYAVIVFNSSKINKPDRIRFTLMHELGHLLLDFGDLPENEVETLCNKFAGAMLLPKTVIQKELGEKRSKLSVQELGNIKKQYGVSMQAIAFRAHDLGIITTSTIKQFFYTFKQLGWNRDEPIQYDYEGKEQSHRFEQLIFRALAEDLISVSKAASLKNKTVAEFRNEYVHM